MAFAGVLVDADVKAALDGCSGEPPYLPSCAVMNVLDPCHVFNLINISFLICHFGGKQN